MKKNEQLQQNEEVSAKEEVIEEKEPITYSHEILQKIEDNRSTFYKSYRVGSIFKWVVAFISIGLLAFAFLGIPNIVKDNNGLKMGLMVGIGALSLIVMVTYTAISKFTLNKKAKGYFADYYQNVTDYVMEDEAYKDYQCVADGKLDREEFDQNLMYKDIAVVGSRGLTTFKYRGLEMKVCDLAAQIKVDRRPKPVFVGKYLISAVKYDLNEPTFVYIKGDEKRSLPPTNLDEVKLVLDDSKMAVYSNDANWSKFLTAKLRNKLVQIKNGNSLVDIAISFRDNKALVCFGYDDDIMILPLQQPFNPKPTEEYKVELGKTAKIIEELN